MLRVNTGQQAMNKTGAEPAERYSSNRDMHPENDGIFRTGGREF
ncbi:hypothetical protein J2W91_005733 [Paenibacillus amylolyticus]|uniref:Uncharacterized protein n=1 Tax=Paenibacillus amylolyticus TaxID=1451 RepID=A0AAP5LPT2_PAEAM|nr:hypothetical protein [Paenibacillus amylolyticus]